MCVDQHRHRLGRRSLAVIGVDVKLHLAQILVAADGRDLEHVAAGFGEPRQFGFVVIVMNTTTELDDIKAALTDDALLRLAVTDAVEALARFATVGRSMREAVVMLSAWQSVFERNTVKARKQP